MLLKVRTNEYDGGEEEETRSSPKIEIEHSLLEILRNLLCLLVQAADLGICGKPWDSHKGERAP